MNNLKLSNFEKNALSQKEQQSIHGGNTCTCACYYRYVGGSSIADNGSANWQGNKHSVHHTRDEAIMIDDEKGGCVNFWEL